jgi:hypothetical protein
VHLVEVDVVHLEPAQAVVDLAEDRLAGQTAAVGAGPHPSCTFVAMTRSSRELVSAFSARPVISSLVPSEYTFAVSKKLIPASRAWAKNGLLEASSRVQACRLRLASP